MSIEATPNVILLADDDPDDREMTRRAFDKSLLQSQFYTVADGEELMDFLHHRGKYVPPEPAPTPGLILLDLNMPRKDGREALMEIKADRALRRIPVVILTTSKAPEDIFRTYDLGSNSYITKRVTQGALVEVATALGKYWFEVVTLPQTPVRS
jgi:CheY-like chemotaxis protein